MKIRYLALDIHGDQCLLETSSCKVEDVNLGVVASLSHRSMSKTRIL